MLNAVVALDRDGAQRAAEESADRWRRGTMLSPVDGAPILVKANIAVAGLPWHAGIAAYGDRIAERDAPAVARLRSAGAVILGLTNMDEGALGASGENAWLGRIGNPYHPGFSAGGSSGGSAAAVAAGLCMAALGTDTIGSIAIPAAYCGVVGHRASRALMPVSGIVPLSPSFDHAGWHTRSVRGARALQAAMGPALPALGHVRIAALDVETEILARFVGCSVDIIAAPATLGDVARQMFEVAEAEGAVVHAQALQDRPDGFSPQLRRMLEWGSSKGSDRREDHLMALSRTDATMRAALAGYDALLLHATPHGPHPAGSPPPPDQATFAALPACLGWPATTVTPDDRGRPALTITARTDAICLSIADRLQPAA